MIHESGDLTPGRFDPFAEEGVKPWASVSLSCWS